MTGKRTAKGRGRGRVDGGVVVKTASGKIVKVRVKARKLNLNSPMAIISYTSPGLGQTNPDSVPDAFTFTAQTGVTIGQTITSNYIDVTGMTLPAAISISGANSPEYQINNLAWTSNAGTVVSGNTVRVRHESSAFDGQTIATLLTIGTVSDTFTSTTETLGTGPAWTELSPSVDSRLIYVNSTGANDGTAIGCASPR